jgi:hypothetical protein
MCDLVEFVTGPLTSRAADLLTAPDERGGAPAATQDIAAARFSADHGGIGSIMISPITPGTKEPAVVPLDGEQGSLAFRPGTA